MTPAAAFAGAMLLALTGVALIACGGADEVFGGPGPFIREGSADAVEIGFRGSASNALPLARRHCAQFEKVPRYVQPTEDGGIFECVRPGAGS